MPFQQISHLKSWVIGSLKSETGSEYLFGFDPQQGLMWLERRGHEYASSDQIWKEAEQYIRTSSLGSGVEIADSPDVWTEEVPVPLTEVIMADTDQRPKTVTKSVVGQTEYEVPRPGDHRIVGDLEPGSPEDVEYADEDIAEQAADFLRNLGEES